MTRFADRRDAGRALGARLAGTVPGDVVVLGLPRGGVVVAAEVAAALGAPLDVLLVRKLGLPGQPELAMGALAAVGDAVETVRTERVLRSADVDEAVFAAVRAEELAELRRREAAYRGDAAPVALTGRSVVLVDDGLATGSTMRAALLALAGQRPARTVVAVPVASAGALAEVRALADDVVCLLVPSSFRAVGGAYGTFAQTSDDEVRDLLGERR
ncbi:phosphoribosyltransferase [Blastococcus sp. TML/M2B]|uniref:phosphoribosyltransferase n=1 Tax=unclassified Blastococcus TaxID=2619396 RepID=UPI001909FD20|nr:MULTISPECIES: phosphoribosyltransferase family protein [unclassified Blastococcus]MBN1094052.1 phosphoribosyltransferase [Blastococcus sp. TML/M2B]MBN1095829.1 phosphoribosyltransferase [Blastococcus sp. TML/C7B]